MDSAIEKILVSEDEIKKTVERISGEIVNDYKDRDKRLVLLGILKGSVVFMGDLMRNIDLPTEIDFMRVSSYGADSKSSGNVRILLDFDRPDISDCDILIVEDIVDSGRTLKYLQKYLENKGAASVKTCTFLDKPSRRVVQFDPDYVGIQIPDEFVIGYGLDYAEKFRTLPFIGVLSRDYYS